MTSVLVTVLHLTKRRKNGEVDGKEGGGGSEKHSDSDVGETLTYQLCAFMETALTNDPFKQ